VIEWSYDTLGREEHARVTTLISGFDGPCGGSRGPPRSGNSRR
jgi:hypothetical protein